MECKVTDAMLETNYLASIDLTRMECKVTCAKESAMICMCIDLTRMECKAGNIVIEIPASEYRFNQNGM